MNVDEIMKRREEAKAKTYSYGGQTGGYTFSILGIKNLESGVFPVRFLWSDPVKNPNGMQLVSTSTVDTVVDGKKKAMRFLSPDMLAPGEGYQGVPQVLKHLDETGKFEKMKEMGDATKTLREAVLKLIPWRRYWAPAFIWAREQAASKPGEYAKYFPTEVGAAAPLDRVLEMNESIKLIEALAEVFRRYPDLDDVNVGRILYIHKNGNRYSLAKVGEPTPLDPALAKFASDNYPDLPGLARKFYFHAPGELASILQSQWWAGSLRSADVHFPDHVDTSLSDLKSLGNSSQSTLAYAPAPVTPQGQAAYENFHDNCVGAETGRMSSSPAVDTAGYDLDPWEEQGATQQVEEAPKRRNPPPPPPRRF